MEDTRIIDMTRSDLQEIIWNTTKDVIEKRLGPVVERRATAKTIAEQFGYKKSTVYHWFNLKTNPLPKGATWDVVNLWVENYLNNRRKHC